MKKLLTYIIFLIFIFKSFACLSAEIQLPDDFKGLTTRARLEELAEDENAPSSVLQTLTIMYEIGNYFNHKYPNNEIFENEFKEKLKPFFPDADETTLNRYAKYLRNSVLIYRIGKTIYNKYVEDKLVPKVYRQVHSDDDYDKPNEVSYIKPEDGYFIKVYNFKKFLTYSSNEEERRAIEEYKKATDADTDIISKIEYKLKRTGWKKIFLYGSQNPLVSNHGLGKTEIGQHIDIRLISPSSFIDGNKELIVGVHIFTRDNYFVLANNLSPDLRKPKIKLYAPDNLESYRIFYPVPINTASLPSVHKYFGDFLIPIKITLDDSEKPIELNAKVNLTTCNKAMECQAESFNLSLTFLPHGDVFLNNGLDNFFHQNISLLPSTDTQNLHLSKFVVDKDEQGESLRLEFKTDTKIKNFKVFLEKNEGYSEFSAPLISMQDNKIYVRFKPVLQNSESFVGKTFIITAVLNSFDAYRDTLKASAASLFDTETQSLNLGLIFLAVLGGFILNFMPCVFPVLSLKIISITQASLSKRHRLRKSLLMTFLGIFSGFSFLIAVLLLAKYLGYALGWGMQYQSIKFLIIMTFILASLIIVFPHLQNLGLQNISRRLDNKFNFILGSLIVLLSTPCTGPYLATAIGFALSGTYLDIIVILYAVAFGLALPYLLAYCLKNPENLLPKPGPWLNKLYFIMQGMLYLTILWFLSLILSQTNWLCVIVLLLCLITFLFFFYIYQKFSKSLDGVFDESISEITLIKLKKISKVCICFIFITCLGISTLVADNSYNKNLIENVANKQAAIDKKLILEKLSLGHPVLLEIDADWCLTCRYNNFSTLNKQNITRWQNLYQLEIIKVDWTNYNAQTLDFMAQYGRKGLPFYILYTPLMKDGIVLPEIFSNIEFEELLINTFKR